MTGISSKPYLSILFFTVGCVCLFLTWHEPLRDFGNYYYGSRLLWDGRFSPELYSSIHFFNQQIASYGETNFFENYIPVPPFSALFYLPFCFFKSLQAKLIFNLVSLLLFCFSVYRLQIFLNLRDRLVYALPLVFFYPFYMNILQGQAYILVCALLIELFMASEKQKVLYPSLLLAIVISLKIFPGIVLLYFLFKKRFDILVSTSAFLLVFLALTAYALPPGTVGYYFTHVLPRLFNNDIIGTYYPGNQSIYTALLHLFSYDALSNPHPVLISPFLIIFLESLFFAFITSLLFSTKKNQALLLFGFVLFGGSLLGRYTTSYSMFLLLPFCFGVLKEPLKSWQASTLFLCVLISVSLPVGSLIHMPFLLKFSRLWGTLFVFLFSMYVYRVRINYKLLVLLFIPVLILKYVTFPVKPITYFATQNTKGILYDIKPEGDSLALMSTLGEKDFKERVLLSNWRHDAALQVRNNSVFYHDELICNSKDTKLNPFIVDDSLLVFMSDLNQGVGFYKLRTIPLKRIK